MKKPLSLPATLAVDTAAQQPDSKPTAAKRGRKRKTPVVHEDPMEVPVPAPAAAMADNPLSEPPAATPAPIIIWTREMLSEAAEQLKARDPGDDQLHALGNVLHRGLPPNFKG